MFRTVKGKMKVRAKVINELILKGKNLDEIISIIAKEENLSEVTILCSVKSLFMRGQIDYEDKLNLGSIIKLPNTYIKYLNLISNQYYLGASNKKLCQIIMGRHNLEKHKAINIVRKTVEYLDYKKISAEKPDAYSIMIKLNEKLYKAISRKARKENRTVKEAFVDIIDPSVEKFSKTIDDKAEKIDHLQSEILKLQKMIQEI